MSKITHKVLIVSPVRNEALTLPILAESLSNLRGNFIGFWAIVENASTDDTLAVSERLKCSVPIGVSSIETTGNMNSAPEFKAFLHAADKYFNSDHSYTHIMKLDADVILDPNYFVNLFSISDVIGMSGGPLAKEQTDTIPGAVKLYSRKAFELIQSFPIALGFDVLDEIKVRQAGLPVEVNMNAKFDLLRETATSQGILRGRKRSGKVCRWSGYSLLYFLLRLIRYTFKKPFIIGSLYMAAGYIFSGKGPFEKTLKRGYRRFQVNKLKFLLTHPNKFKKTYYSFRQI